MGVRGRGAPLEAGAGSPFCAPGEDPHLAYAPAYPHDPIEEIYPDVFMVRGSARMNPAI